MEAFSDGVIAILITIMVLELHAPESAEWAALRPLTPVFLAYALSFLIVGIYWANHHHLLQLCERVNGGVLWANLHLLFWLSLIPFTTAWMGEHYTASAPTALYGVVLLGAGAAYSILQRALIGAQGSHSELANAVGRDLKGKFSVAGYVIGLPISFVYPSVAKAIYLATALVWLVPDRRIEKHLRNR